MQPDLQLPDLLTEQLRRVRSRLVGVSVANGVGLTVFVVSLSLSIGLVLDFWLELPISFRITLLIAVPVIGLLTGACTILRPFMMQFRDSELAAVVEAAHPELKERLLTAVELAEGAAAGEDGGSPLMRRWLLQQSMEFARVNDFADVIDGRRAVRRCWLGGISVLALLLPLLFASDAYAVLLSRFFNPWGNYERLQNLILIVDDADRVVGREDDVHFTVHVDWRFRAGIAPESAWLNWRTSEKDIQKRRLDWNAAEKHFSITLPRVDRSFDYFVSAEQSRTKLHRIEVVDRPRIDGFSVDITPPAYTGEPAVHHEILLGELIVIEQSRVALQLKFNQPLVSAEIHWLDIVQPAPEKVPGAQETKKPAPSEVARTGLPLAEDGLSAHLELTAALSGPAGRFIIRTVGEHGLHARVEPVYRLTTQPDRAPLIEFADNEQHPSARPEDVLQIPVRAEDDFGLADVELHYQFLRDGIQQSGKFAVPADQRGARQINTAFEVDLGKLNLTDGMQVSLRARATDERPVPAPNESWTATRLLQIRADAKPYGEQTLAEQQHRVNQAMSQLQNNLEQQRQNARKLQADTQTDEARKNEWKRDADVAAMEDRLRELAGQMQKFSAILDQQPIFQPLAAQMQNLADQELAQATAKADEARQAEMGQKAKKLSEAAERLQKAQQKLQKIQKEHEQLAQLQRDMLELNRLAENTEQLAERVDELVQRRPSPPEKKDGPATPQAEQWNEDHQKLVARHNQLDQDLSGILKDHPELLEQARESLKHQMASLAEQAELLGREERALSRSAKQAAQDAIREMELRQRQDRLLQQARQLADSLKLPHSEKMNFNGEQATLTARRASDEANLQTALQQHQLAQQQLEELHKALEQNESLPADPAERLQEMARRQQQIADALEKTSEKQSPNAEQLTALAMQQAALQRAIAELPDTELTRGQRQEALKRSQESGQKLAEKQATSAAEQSREAAKALSSLADELQSADAAQRQQLSTDAVQKQVETEREQSQQIQEQVQNLAQQQQQTAQEIAAAISPAEPTQSSNQQSSNQQSPNQQSPNQQSPNQQPSNQQPSNQQPSNQQPSNQQPSNQQPSNQQPSNQQSPNQQSPNQQSPNPQSPNPQSPNPQTPANLAQLSPAQQALAQQAKEIGERVRDLKLKSDPANRASSEFPNLSRAAAHELSEANFKRAAEMSRQAAEKAQQLAQSLADQTGEQVSGQLQEHAQAASQQQTDLAKQLKQLSESKEMQEQFRQQRQQAVQQQAQQLQEQLAKKAEQMELKQIDRKENAKLAEKGQEQVAQARQSIQKTIDIAQQGNRGEAAELGEQSVAALQQAANLSRQAADGGKASRPPENPVPGDVGQQIAESAQHLDQAGKQLAQLGVPQRSSQGQQKTQQQGTPEQGEKPESNPGQSTPQQAGEEASSQQQAGNEKGQSGDQPNAGQSEQTQTGQSQASQSLREAAQNMRQAAQQMGLAMGGENNGQTSQRPTGRESKDAHGNQPGETASDGSLYMNELEHALGTMSSRDWGKLPGTLQTELLESSHRQPDAAYRGLIRQYFQEISKARPAQLENTP